MLARRPGSTPQRRHILVLPEDGESLENEGKALRGEGGAGIGHVEVEMRPRRIAREAEGADHLSTAHALIPGHAHASRLEVLVERVPAASEVERDVIAAGVADGIRAALGATPRNLLLLSLGSGVRQAGAGLVIGIVAALALTRTMNSMLQGVTATDPVTFVSVVVVTAVVAIGASLIPARRAAKTDLAKVMSG